ncbi:immunoglobulin superfamily member 1-like [Notamacropus eugenii]|uniref:immunoglobulin superfamily member 1-like n=1 Tax=Notamacropus eugenii TaxID=9315 RepID=UPI003B6819C1
MQKATVAALGKDSCGTLTKPLISAFPGSTISPGTRVTIQCQIPSQAPLQNYNFALLEANTLEPLQKQSPTGTLAVFSLLSVTAENTGSYSCIYYKKTAPYSGSHPSQTLELTVSGSGQLPKPTLWTQSGLVVAPGANITLWCSRIKLSSLGEATFTLGKAGTQEPLKQQISADLWTSFSLSSLRPEDTGNYSCAYKERRVPSRLSKPSETLELLVTGSLPKPSLSALPGLIVKPGMHVTLQCRQPSETFLSDLTFTLLKIGTPQPLQRQSPAGTSADFNLLSVKAQDTGKYHCVYHRRMVPYHLSEPSDVLEMWVTDALPKPSLSVWPVVVSGADVTLLCQGPSWSSSFVLYKDRNKKILSSMDNTHYLTKFVLSHVTPKHSGNYSCSYQLSINGSVWTQHSDPLQLIVRGKRKTPPRSIGGGQRPLPPWVPTKK